MAYLGDINLNDIPPNEYDPVPPGDYMVVITDSDSRIQEMALQNTFVLTFQIIEGQSKGRLIWQNLSLNDPDPKWLGAAKRRLRAIYNAVCKPSGVNDSSELYNIPHLVSLEIEPAKNGYPAKPYQEMDAIQSDPIADRHSPASRGSRYSPAVPASSRTPASRATHQQDGLAACRQNAPGASRSTSRKTRRSPPEAIEDDVLF